MLHKKASPLPFDQSRAVSHPWQTLVTGTGPLLSSRDPPFAGSYNSDVQVPPLPLYRTFRAVARNSRL
jgi:hypothetical protein